MTRAAIYTRISRDRNGESESPERQEAIARGLAEAKGWDVVEVFSDRDLSAYRKGVQRPGYEALLKDARSGKLDAIVVWSITRLARTVREFSRLMDELDTLGVSLTSARDQIDTSTATGRAMAQIHGVFAEMESATISSRVRDAQAHNRAAGKMWTGGSRPFGWRGGEQEPAEAKIVVEVAERLIRGETRAAVARDLDARGVRTSAGNSWTGTTLWQMVTAPIHAGYRVYDGEVYEGNWEPILPRETHNMLLTLRGRSGRRTDSLLVGTIVCGACFKNMHMRRVNGHRTYACRRQAGWDGCGGVSIRGDRTDDHVTTAVLDFLSTAKLLPLGGSYEFDMEATKLELEDAEASLVKLAQDYYVRKVISEAEFEAVREPLSTKANRARMALASMQEALDEASQVPIGSRTELESWWSSAQSQDRRNVIQRALRQIVVHPVGKGGSRWRPERIELRWNYGLFLDAAGQVEGDEAEYQRIRREAERE